MPAVGNLLLYVAVSLFDSWPDLPPVVHGVLFALLVGVVIGRLVFALRILGGAEGPPPVRWGRYLLLLPLLVVGFYQAGQDWDRRLVVGFTPALLFPAPSMDVDARIIPPDYTGHEEVMLDNGQVEDGIVVPEGSRIVVTARDTRWPPVLRWNGAGEPLRAEEDGSYRITAEIRADSEITLAFGDHRLAHWSVRTLADETPDVTLLAPARMTPRQSVRIQFSARDDYGVARMLLRLRPLDQPQAEPEVVELPAYDTRLMQDVQYLDLTGQPLAGTAVSAELVAVDARGQLGASIPFEMDLPRRRFTNATALSIMGARDALMAGGEEMGTALRRLAGLTESDVFPSDTTVHLGLRIAYLRLREDPAKPMRDEMADLLWSLALRAEDGTLSLSEIALHETLNDTLTLIKTGVNAGEVETAVRMLALRFEEFGHARTSSVYINPGVRVAEEVSLRQSLDWTALRRFFTRITMLARDGSMAEVVELLEDLQNGLEQRPDLLLSATAYRQYLVASHARRMVDELTREQRVLMSRSFAVPIEGLPKGAVRSYQTGLVGNQRALRDALVTLIEHLDNAGLPDLTAFYRAKQAMDDVVRSLEAGTADEGAASAQVQVLTALDVASRTLDNVPSPLLVDDEGRVKDPLGRPLPPMDNRPSMPVLDRIKPSLRP